MSKFVTFEIFRYDPEKDKEPYYQSYKVEIRRPGMLMLEGLNQIKWEQDTTLAFRRSCREGVCGSDGINVNGVNMLSCMTKIEDLGSDHLVIQPLPGMPVMRDLVTDVDDFFEKFITVKPYLIRKSPAPDKEYYQSPEDRKKLDGLYECILCGCCSSSCPSYWADKKYLGPNAFLRAYRYLIDSRDEGAEERLPILNDKNGVWRCHTIYNCVEACPKELNPTKAIVGIRQMLLERKY
ncbi:succinate dehydrogenase iron-sulfur subunit [Deferribacteraceae bacterium V6Fe1]|jgi:succinate dehydrogenase / fumarate reductase iron-sulfur subunit|uniref:succinate dehydrogenase iron-sulfur subunit n=1 Tax=Deferrivibrio essentukiensis TaxID=2880922 RepID=UPI001F60B7B1|nr:succinate dehydrogenase iron-sulfur subunit [Deferrivibrio essentukiensis]MBZ4671906.1 sdhB [Deferribacteraceae bacterium]MCB4203825.1 succinate dehydrogenase iron-sulfur subunit [Deferrivibrio essentukiensis]UOD35814.1 succinate dehydrogenase iron-sulfur subunit [Deferribacteraceae bacterium V6Fe1]